MFQDPLCLICFPLAAMILAATTLAFTHLVRRRRVLGFSLGFASGLVLGPLMIELILLKNRADLFGSHLAII